MKVEDRALGILVSFATTLALVAGPGASVAETRFEAGVRAGLGMSGLDGSGLAPTTVIEGDIGGGYVGRGQITYSLAGSRPGFVGGAYGLVRWGERLGLRLEALVADKGAQGDNAGLVDIFSNGDYVGSLRYTGRNTLTLTYLEVPALAVVSTPVGSSARFDVFGGPEIAFKLRARTKSTLDESTEGVVWSTSNRTQDLSGQTSATDVGAVLGIGYSHDDGEMILSADLRWVRGFTKVDASGASDWTNHALQLSVGVGFPVGGAR